MKTTVHLDRFVDDTYTLSHLRTRWRIRVSRAYPGGYYGAAGTTAVIADMPPRSPRRVLSAELAERAVPTLLGSPGKLATSSLADLKAQVGRPVWGDDWTQRPLTMLGLRFDAVLVARALACVSSREVVTVDVSEVDTTPVLRIIGSDWRVCVAGMRKDHRKAPIVKLKRLITKRAA